MIYTSLIIFYNFLKNIKLVPFFYLLENYYINCLRYAKKLKINHKKEKWVK